jgi:hypothetical protein
MGEPAIEDDVVREVLDDSLPEDWELQVVDGSAAVAVHTGDADTVDVGECDALMRLSGYELKYISRAGGDYRLLYTEER